VTPGDDDPSPPTAPPLPPRKSTTTSDNAPATKPDSAVAYPEASTAMHAGVKATPGKAKSRTPNVFKKILREISPSRTAKQKTRASQASSARAEPGHEERAELYIARQQKALAGGADANTLAGALTAEQYGLIGQYVGGWDAWLNKSLRSGVADQKAITVSHLLTTALKAAPDASRHEGTAYRGTHLPRAQLDKILAAQEFTDPAFLSTSTDRATAERHLGKGGNDDVGVVFELHGKRGVKMQELSLGNNDSDVLFDRGVRFKLDEALPPDGSRAHYVLRMREHSDNRFLLGRGGDAPIDSRLNAPFSAHDAHYRSDNREFGVGTGILPEYDNRIVVQLEDEIGIATNTGYLMGNDPDRTMLARVGNDHIPRPVWGPTPSESGDTQIVLVGHGAPIANKMGGYSPRQVAAMILEMKERMNLNIGSLVSSACHGEACTADVANLLQAWGSPIPYVRGYHRMVSLDSNGHIRQTDANTRLLPLGAGDVPITAAEDTVAAMREAERLAGVQLPAAEADDVRDDFDTRVVVVNEDANFETRMAARDIAKAHRGNTIIMEIDGSGRPFPAFGPSDWGKDTAQIRYVDAWDSSDMVNQASAIQKLLGLKRINEVEFAASGTDRVARNFRDALPLDFAGGTPLVKGYENYISLEYGHVVESKVKVFRPSEATTSPQQANSLESQVAPSGERGASDLN
jgi:hypothetical protein